MLFIKYEKSRNSSKNLTNVVSINSHGRITLYKSIFQEHFHNAEYVELYYDPKENQIGILPFDCATPNTIKIKGKTTKAVLAKKFLKSFMISINQKFYPVRINDDMVIIQL